MLKIKNSLPDEESVRNEKAKERHEEEKVEKGAMTGRRRLDSLLHTMQLLAVPVLQLYKSNYGILFVLCRRRIIAEW